MKKLEIEEFTKILLKDFPAFIDKMKPDDLQPYVLFGDFGIYIRDLIDHGNYDENELEKIFKFLNAMGNSPDDDVHHVLIVGVLEILTDSKIAVMLANRKLKGEALKELGLIKKSWYD